MATISRGSEEVGCRGRKGNRRQAEQSRERGGAQGGVRVSKRAREKAYRLGKYVARRTTRIPTRVLRSTFFLLLYSLSLSLLISSFLLPFFSFWLFYYPFLYRVSDFVCPFFFLDSFASLQFFTFVPVPQPLLLPILFVLRFDEYFASFWYSIKICFKRAKSEDGNLWWVGCLENRWEIESGCYMSLRMSVE